MYFYYNMLSTVILICLPQGIDTHYRILWFASNVFYDIVSHYFHFKSCVITMLSVQIFFFIGRVIFDGDSFDGKLVVKCLFFMIWQYLNFLAFHLLIKKMGFIYCDSKVVSDGNE